MFEDFLSRLPIQIVEVSGNSMHPTYKEGEVLLATSIIPRLNVGDVIIFKHPVTRKFNIKRVTRIDKSRATGNPIFDVEGDNSADSFDSRDYGSLPMKCVCGRLFDQRPKK